MVKWFGSACAGVNRVYRAIKRVLRKGGDRHFIMRIVNFKTNVCRVKLIHGWKGTGMDLLIRLSDLVFGGVRPDGVDVASFDLRCMFKEGIA